MSSAYEMWRDEVDDMRRIKKSKQTRKAFIEIYEILKVIIGEEEKVSDTLQDWLMDGQDVNKAVDILTKHKDLYLSLQQK